MQAAKTKLTDTESAELVDRIASGEITRSCKRTRRDWFDVRLSSGRRAVGCYEWETGNGEFARLDVRHKEGTRP